MEVPHLRRHRRARWFHPRRGGGESHPVGGQHADEAARRGTSCSARCSKRDRRQNRLRRRQVCCSAMPGGSSSCTAGVPPCAARTVGSVRIGTPDGYVMRFLPAILSLRQTYPLVQVEGALRHLAQPAGAQRPRPLHRHPQAGQRSASCCAGSPLVWMAAEGSAPTSGRSRWPCSAPPAFAGPGPATPGGGGTGSHRYSSPSLSALFRWSAPDLAVTLQLRSLLTGDHASSTSEACPPCPRPASC